MSVIKAGQTGSILKRLSTVDLADHLAEARAVIEQAKRRAAQIVSDAEVQAKQLQAWARKSGYEAGYKQGHAEGTQAGHNAAHEESTRRFEQEHADIVADMQSAVTEIERIKEDLMIAAHKDLLDFAVLVARKLTFAIGRLHPESVRENLGRALRLVGSNTNLTIRVHPNDVASMEEYAQSVLKQVNASRAVSIAADDSLAPGGCVVETGRTRVDATLETQVDEMVSLLLNDRARMCDTTTEPQAQARGVAPVACAPGSDQPRRIAHGDLGDNATSRDRQGAAEDSEASDA